MHRKIIAGDREPKLWSKRFRIGRWTLELFWERGLLLEKSTCKDHPGMAFEFGGHWSIAIRKVDITAGNQQASEHTI